MQFSVKKKKKILEEEGRKKHKIQSSCQSCCNGWTDRKRKKDWIIEISVSINAWPVCLTNNGAWGRRMRGREMRRRDAANGGKSQQGRRSISNKTLLCLFHEALLKDHGRLTTSEAVEAGEDERQSIATIFNEGENHALLMYRRCIYRCHRFLYTRSSVVYNGDAGKLFSYSDLMLCMCTQLRARQTATRFLPPAPVIFVYIAAWLAVVQRQPAISQQLLLALALFLYFFIYFFFIFSIFILFFFFFVGLFFRFRYFNHFSAFTLFLSLALLLFNTMRGCDNPSFPSKMYIQYVADVYIHVHIYTACK